MKKDELKNRLKKAMEIRQMKAVDLVVKTGIPKSAMSYYTSGKAEPKADRIYLISKALDVSEAWLLGYDVEMERTEEQRRNSIMSAVVERLKNDHDFLNTVSKIYELNDEQYKSIKSLLSAFNSK